MATLAAESEFCNFKKLKKMKGFNALTRKELQKILEWSGYKVHGECEGDAVQNEVEQGNMIYSLNINAGFRLMQMCLDLKDN